MSKPSSDDAWQSTLVPEMFSRSDVIEILGAFDIDTTIELDPVSGVYRGDPEVQGDGPDPVAWSPGLEFQPIVEAVQKALNDSHFAFMLAKKAKAITPRYEQRKLLDQAQKGLEQARRALSGIPGSNVSEELWQGCLDGAFADLANERDGYPNAVFGYWFCLDGLDTLLRATEEGKARVASKEGSSGQKRLRAEHAFVNGLFRIWYVFLRKKVTTTNPNGVSEKTSGPLVDFVDICRRKIPGFPSISGFTLRDWVDDFRESIQEYQSETARSGTGSAQRADRQKKLSD